MNYLKKLKPLLFFLKMCQRWSLIQYNCSAGSCRRSARTASPVSFHRQLKLLYLGVSRLSV